MRAVFEHAYDEGASAMCQSFMTQEVVTVTPDASIVDLAGRFQESYIKVFR